MPAPTRLARMGGATPAPAPEASRTRLGQAISVGPLSRERVEIPRLGPAWIVLAPHAAVQRIEGETFRAMAELGLELSSLTALTYEAERAVRTLAEAVRDPDDPDQPFGTLAEWRDHVDVDIIAGAWQVYGDVRMRLDPVSVALTEDERAAINAAVEKKNAMLLRSYGVAALASYLATTADPPSS